MKTALTRSQRTRKINKGFGNLTKEDKIELDSKIIEALESDHYEEIDSSHDSSQESEDFKDGEEPGNANLLPTRKKFKRKRKKDKRTSLSKSKFNLKQIVMEEDRKEGYRRTLNFSEMQANTPKFRKGLKICKICYKKANYSCPRCRDPFCNEICYTHHKEFVCAHIEYNYFH